MAIGYEVAIWYGVLRCVIGWGVPRQTAWAFSVASEGSVVWCEKPMIPLSIYGTVQLFSVCAVKSM